MALGLEEKDSIKQRFDIISDFLEGDGLASDVTPYIRQIMDILAPHLEREDIHPDTLRDAVDIYSSFANVYERTDRIMLAAECYDRAIDYAARLYRDYGGRVEDDCDLVYSAIRAHNYYLDDDCEDIRALATIFLDDDAKDVFSRIYACRRHLRHDPIELTTEYLAVIDEVEVLVEENREFYGFGSCHHVWELKKQYLAERGIVWHTPSELNPWVMFD